MTCQYCGENKKLVKAHVIPEGFFRRLREGQDPPRLLSNKKNEYPQKTPIGVYDKNILCEECERRFDVWDMYAQELLRDEPKNGSLLMKEDQIVGWEVPNFNYKLLKLFFVSLLWRASVSSHKVYSKIKIGPYETVAKRLIDKDDPGSPDDFSVLLAKFVHPLGIVIFDPFSSKFEGVNCCTFYLGGYVAYLKTDKRPFPEPLSHFIMRPDKPLIIVKRDFEKSKELPLMINIASSANKQ